MGMESVMRMERRWRNFWRDMIRIVIRLQAVRPVSYTHLVTQSEGTRNKNVADVVDVPDVHIRKNDRGGVILWR